MKTNKDRKNDASPAQTRWHDKPLDVALSVGMMENFPSQYQPLLGDTIVQLAEKHYQAAQRLDNIKALNPEKILSLFKAKAKARSYDKVESLHRAISCLFVLPEPERLFIATQVSQVVNHLVEYFCICQRTEQSISGQVVRELAETFVAGNLKNTVEYLSTFHPSMHLPNGPTLQSIRAQLAQSKAKAFAEELAEWQQRQMTPVPPSTEQSAEQSNETFPKKQAPTDAPSSEDKPPPKKDEMVALGNRDMKIRLDKLDL